MASIWQLTIIVFSKKTIVLGVVLKGSNKVLKRSSSKIANAACIAKSYFKTPCPGAQIELKWGKVNLKAETDSHGFFSLTSEVPFDVNQNLKLLLDANPLPIKKETLNLYEVGKNDELIISDIDDTVVVSHTNRRLKSILTTLFKTSMERQPVTSTSKLFDALGDKHDIVYVSRSEYNLFPVLSNFMKHHHIPRGPLLLTPFLTLTELIRNRKDPDFKIKTIHLLLEHSNHKQIVLVGDDTQHDLHVYAEIAKSFGDRIRRIFIRQTDPRKDRRFSKEWKQLDHFVDNMVYFEDSTDLTDLKY